MTAGRFPAAFGRANSAGMLPSGAVIAQRLEAGAETRAVARDAIPPGWAVYDIDPATERDFAARISGAGTVVWNGPMGVFETPPFDHGTLAVARAMADATARGAVTVIGGSDIFAMFHEDADRIELTEVLAEIAGDTFMPDPRSEGSWREIACEDHLPEGKREGFRFTTLVRA